MSRVAKKPIVLPQGVAVDLHPRADFRERPSGRARVCVHPAVSVRSNRMDSLSVQAGGWSGRGCCHVGHDARLSRQYGDRSECKGFERKLSLVGVGYRAQAQGDTLNLTLGFSHPVGVQAAQRHHCYDPDADRNRHQGSRPAARWPGGCRGSCLSSAGALQGQGRALCRRSGRDQRNEEEEVRVLR
jgi:hypothetical protein